MKSQVFGVLLSLGMALSCSAGKEELSGEKYVYVELNREVDRGFTYAENMHSGSGRIILDFDRMTFTRKEITGTLHLCSDRSSFLCVKNDVLPFAVPREELPFKESWTANSSEFRITNRSKNIRINGKLLTVMEIVSDQPSGLNNLQNPLRYRFYYSTDHGLVAFSARLVDCGSIPPDPSLFIDDFCSLGGDYGSVGDQGLFRRR